MTFITAEVRNRLIDFIEVYHTVTGEFPGRSQINDTIILADDFIDQLNPRDVDELLEDSDFNKSLDERGIIAPWSMLRDATGLTREQIAVAAILNNPKDRRSDSKKLEHLGISSRKYAGWIHDKHYAAYLKKSANNLLENMEADAHMGLLRQVSAGNIGASKLYFEMTGRWNPAHESELNVQVLMTRFIEIIQTHVHDPETLIAIAADLQLAAVETGAKPIMGDQAGAIEGRPVGSVKTISSGIEEDNKFKQPDKRLSF